MMNNPPPLDLPTTCDTIYNGAVTLLQPAKGYRVNLDTVLLAAAIPNMTGKAMELGAGVGGVSLGVARRCPGLQITAIELDEDMVQWLEQNITHNAMDDRITAIKADALMATPPWAGQMDMVMTNPPYHDAGSTQSPNSQQSLAKATADLAAWVGAAAAALKPKGRLVMICRADRLDHAMAALAADFGEIAIKPVQPKLSEPAKRVLITARKGVKGGGAILPSFVIGQEMAGDAMGGQNLTPQMLAVQNGEAGIDMAIPGRHMKNSAASS
jgi:tRNA1(Val) A37 N6-methylase TrmN6